MVNNSILSTSERNNMGRERLLTCLAECGAEHEPVVLLELQKAYFNKYDEYLNKAELRKFFSKGHIKQVFENFMPKDVDMATDVNATGSLFLKMKRSLQVAIADSPKTAPLMTVNTNDTSRPNLMPLAPPEPQPTRKVLPSSEKFRLPLVPAHKLLPPNRKKSFSLAGGFGGVGAEEQQLENLLDHFVPSGSSTAYGKEKAFTAATTTLGSTANNKSVAKKQKTVATATKEKCIWEEDFCAKRATDKDDSDADDNNNLLEMTGNDEAEEDSELGDTALENGYQQLKRQAAAKKTTKSDGTVGRSDGGGKMSVPPSLPVVDGTVTVVSSLIKSRRQFVAATKSGTDLIGHDENTRTKNGGERRGGGGDGDNVSSLLEAKWAAERRARDELVADRLRNRKLNQQQPQRAPALYSDDWEADGQQQEKMHKTIDGANSNRVTKSEPLPASAPSTMRRFVDKNNDTKTKKVLLYGGNSRFRGDIPPPFAPNLMSSSDEGEEGEDNEEAMTNNNNKAQQDGTVQGNKNNNNMDFLLNGDENENDDDDEEEEEEGGPMMTMNRTDIYGKEGAEEEDSACQNATTPEELKDEETEQFYQQFATGPKTQPNTANDIVSKKFSVEERNKFIGLISTVMSMLQNVNSADLDLKLANLSPSGAYRKAFPSAAELLAFIDDYCPNIITVKVSKHDMALLWSERSDELMSLLLQKVGKMIFKKSGGVTSGTHH